MKDNIIYDLKDSYGITCNQITPVAGGWLNLKWKVSTDKGDLLVKQYSTERYSKDKIERIETALNRQIVIKKRGVLCPSIWKFGDRVIRWLDDKTAYMVMDFCSGKTEKASTITIAQMKSLGSTCAVMHKEFSQIQDFSVRSLPVFGGYTLDLLWENFNSRRIKCSSDTQLEYQKALLNMEPILKGLGNDFFDKFPKGLTHEDFQPGNILFAEDAVSAIIDFDRNCYSYIWHDIGRAVLSFALEENILNSEKIYAFIEGYSQHLDLTSANVADALKLTWCIETPWWIQPEFFGKCNEIPRRFRDEMLWMTEHWFEVDSLL